MASRVARSSATAIWLAWTVGAVVDGFHGDSAVTVGVGNVSPACQDLIDVTREALERGIGAARHGARVGDVGSAVQSFVESKGYSVVREYVGHGIGRALHEEPQVPNFGAAGLRYAAPEGHGNRHRADGERGRLEDEGAGRQLDRGHGGREPVCPLREHTAHHRG